MTTDTDFAEDLTTALAALDIDTELVRVAWAEVHPELRSANIYGTLLCRSGSCRMAGIMSRGAIRVYGYAPDLRTVPVGDCGQHESEEVAQQIAELINSGRRDAESRATHPEAWTHETAKLWMDYRWKPMDALARMQRLANVSVVPGDAPGITLCAAATSRLSSEGLPTDTEEQTTCCYAVQDKVWVTGPGAERWEVYTVLADSQPELEGQSNAADGCDTSDGCCAPARSDDSSKTADLAAESQGCC